MSVVPAGKTTAGGLKVVKIVKTMQIGTKNVSLSTSDLQ